MVPRYRREGLDVDSLDDDSSDEEAERPTSAAILRRRKQGIVNKSIIYMMFHVSTNKSYII